MVLFMKKSTGFKDAFLTEVRSLLRFSLTGIINVFVDVAAYSILIYCGLQSFQAQPISITLGLASSYLINRRFTFHTIGKVIGYQLIKFLAVSAVCIGISPIIMYYIDFHLGLGEIYAKIPVTLIVGLLNYTLSRLFVFRSMVEMYRSFKKPQQQEVQEEQDVTIK